MIVVKRSAIQEYGRFQSSAVAEKFDGSHSLHFGGSSRLGG
jgi:hypothetical protein